MRTAAVQKVSVAIVITLISLGIAPAHASAQGLWKKLKEQIKQAEELQKQQQQKQSQSQPSQQQGQQRNSTQQRTQANSGANQGAGSFSPPPGTKVVKQFMAPAQSGAKFIISPHGVNVATLENAGSREVVYYDGVEGPRFDQIITENPPWYGSAALQVIFSPDGKRYAYCGRSGNEFVVMVDGKESARSSETQNGNITGTSCMLGFTPDSRHFFYTSLVIKVENGRTVSYSRFVFDGKSEPLSDTGHGVNSQGIEPVFSPDGNHFAYIAADPADFHKLQLIVDGKVLPFRGGDLQWSADSQHLYTTLISRVPRRGQVVEGMIDGKPFIRAENLKLYIPPVGNMVVAVVGANRGVAHFLVIDGKKIPASEVDGPGANIDKVTFSPDGKHYAARLTNAQYRKYAFVDGKRGEEYQEVDHLAFTADSTKAVYTGFANGKTFIVYGGQESDPCTPDIVQGIVLAPQGSSAGAICVGNPPMLFMNGRTTPITAVGAKHLSFTPDGRHYVYVTDTHGNRQLVIDGMAQKASHVAAEDAPSIPQYVISPGGEHIAHFASGPGPAGPYTRGVFVDGKFIPTDTNSMFYRLEFTRDGKHLMWAEPATSSRTGAVRIFIDGKPVAQTDPAIQPFTQEHWWDISPDGTLNALCQDDKGLERITITPSPSTSVDSLLAMAH